jgi:hypothetical protein
MANHIKLPKRETIKKIIKLTADESNGEVWGMDIPLGSMEKLIDAAILIIKAEKT